jgi:putative nucleotidyltransferase with HDIG domain
VSTPEQALRAALAGQDAWLVGGAVRDRLLGRPVTDFDVALAGDAADAARRLAREARGTPFSLSDAFGAWRVIARDRSWQVDFVPLRDGDLAADLQARDFTVNAMAEPLAGGEVIDLHGGREDLAAGRLRMVSEHSLADDPLRTLRAARFAAELGLEIDPETAAAARRHAPGLGAVAAERIFAELKRLLCAPGARAGLELMEDLGVAAQVLPELPALRGVEQNVFHHADVHDHTLEVLERAAEIERDPSLFGEHAQPVAALLSQPLADELTRGQGLRFGALLHDVAKPATRGERPDGRVTFIGHDAVGAEMAAAILRRWRASERLAEYVAALTRHHLHLGFLVHRRPLDARTVWRYLTATAPYTADVTILTVADRLATRGRNADEAIAAHLELAREMLGHGFAQRPGEPLVRGDDLARELGRAPGPWLGDLLAQLEEDRFAGEVVTREQAIERARRLLG